MRVYLFAPLFVVGILLPLVRSGPMPKLKQTKPRPMSKKGETEQKNEKGHEEGCMQKGGEKDEYWLCKEGKICSSSYGRYFNGYRLSLEACYESCKNGTFFHYKDAHCTLNADDSITCPKGSDCKLWGCPCFCYTESDDDGGCQTESCSEEDLSPSLYKIKQRYEVSMKTRKKALLEQAYVTEKARMYHKMAQKMKELVALDSNLDEEERRMLKVALTGWTNDLSKKGSEKELYAACEEITLTLLLHNVFARTQYQINEAYQSGACNVNSKNDFPSDEFDQLMKAKVFYLEMMKDFLIKASVAAEFVEHPMIKEGTTTYNNLIRWFNDDLKDSQIAPCILKNLHSMESPVARAYFIKKDKMGSKEWDQRSTVSSIRQWLTYTVKEFDFFPDTRYYISFNDRGIKQPDSCKSTVVNDRS